MDITFDLSHVARATSRERSEVEGILRNALQCINQSYRQNGRPSAKPLYREGAPFSFIPTFTFHLEHVFYPGASKREEAQVLRILLDALIYIDVAYLRFHPGTRPLYGGQVIYGRTEIWDPIPALYARGYGDCKSLSAALIAEYLHRGKEAVPTFRFNPRQNGAKDFHILVMTETGWKDPSRKLGMGADENSYFQRR